MMGQISAVGTPELAGTGCVICGSEDPEQTARKEPLSRLLFDEGEQPMAKTPRGRAQDRKLAAGAQAYELRYFARKHGLTADQARGILQYAGPSREKANRLAERK